MRHDVPRNLLIVDLAAPDPWHDAACICPACHPPHPADRADHLSPNRIALLVLAGLATGEAIGVALDHAGLAMPLIRTLGL